MRPVDEAISRARTPDKRVYGDPEVYRQILERAFVPSWQWVGDHDPVKIPGATWPTILLEGSLEEPLVFTRDLQDQVRCLSNVCTHRGMLVCEAAGNERFLRCRYHGRRFGLDGGFQFMPEFEGVEGFPGPEDDLPKVAHAQWGPFLFASLAPSAPFAEVFGPMLERLSFAPMGDLVKEPTRVRDYLVKANWALYIDNYLEGFHIPFIHAELNQVLDYGSYLVEKLPHGVLQLAVAKDGEDAFEHLDEGRRIAAYYYWFFPNLMVNVYPWGISINVIKPLGPDLTRVSFIGYAWDRSRMEVGAGAALDRVEREDEVVVELVHKGLKSRFYHHGRYSVAREDGTHHFHRLLTGCLQGA